MHASDREREREDRGEQQHSPGQGRTAAQGLHRVASARRSSMSKTRGPGRVRADSSRRTTPGREIGPRESAPRAKARS